MALAQIEFTCTCPCLSIAASFAVKHLTTSFTHNILPSMANEWEDPPNAHLLHNLQHVDGLGWGPIDPEDLQPQKWEPLLQNELGRGQYTRFVTGMLNRIRFEEGSIEEVKLFADLLSNENPAFLRVATPWIPELNEPT